MNAWQFLAVCGIGIVIGMIGKFRSHWDAIIRAAITGSALVVAFYAPYAWYWRIAIFLAITYVARTTYGGIRLYLERRREGFYQ
jgi:hypothetical protein